VRTFDEVCELVRAERFRQLKKWGDQTLTENAPTWAAILTEETGEVAKAVLEAGVDLMRLPVAKFFNQDQEDELIQVAAVAISWVMGMGER